ncbi:unnamed protein product [Caenorhabditis brenneri]
MPDVSDTENDRTQLSGMRTRPSTQPPISTSTLRRDVIHTDCEFSFYFIVNDLVYSGSGT